MPEVRECFMHYKHAHYVLVEQLGLDRGSGPIWTLCGLWADATKSESGEGSTKTLASGLTTLHAKGYVDKINNKCKLARGQKSHQTKIWPAKSGHALDSLDSLVLQGVSYTPRSLILSFGDLDLQVTTFTISGVFGEHSSLKMF